MRESKKTTHLRYRRVLLKLSGEVFQNPDSGEPLDFQALENVAYEISNVWKRGIQMAVVMGGGNIFRGLPASKKGFDRVTGDYVGMIATAVNALALHATLQKKGVPTEVMSAIAMPPAIPRFDRRKALELLDRKHVLLLACGTGNPFFTTDSAAALRASEIGADILLKATKVDGIYEADPVTHPNAKRFKRITYQEALSRQLKVMDAAAFSICMENRIPIIVFNFFERGSVAKVLEDPRRGTLVTD